MKKNLIIILLIGLGLGGIEFVALPNEAEAGAIKCYGKHGHRGERGRASCKGDLTGHRESRGFRTSVRKKYKVTLPNLPNDYYTVTVAGYCGAFKSISNVGVQGLTTYVKLDY